MAEVYRMPHNPVRSLKRELKSMQSDSHSHEEILKTLFENNAQTQLGVNQVSKKLNELIDALRNASDNADSDKTEGKLKIVEEKLDRIIQQNLQLIQVVVDLVKLLKRDKSLMPPSPPAYTGVYPLRPLR